MAPASPSPLGFFEHLRLLIRLRLDTAANRYRKATGAAAAAGGLALLGGVAVGLGVGAYAALGHPAVGASDLWSSMLLRLATFFITTVFVAWPLLSAGVDEHSELSRFSTFPISPLRLFAASSVSALFEPRALVFYPAILGAALGFSRHHPVSLGQLLGLVAAYSLFNIAWGRAGLTLVLNVLRHRRSAEILGLIFLAALFLPAVAPPADVAWLYQLIQNGAQVAAVGDDTRILAMHSGLGRIPPCALARGMEQAWLGSGFGYGIFLSELLIFAAIGFALSFWLLLRFYSGTAKPAPPSREKKGVLGKLKARDGALWALIDRESSDWLRNPKARLLVAVPFFLCILLRFSSARELAVAFQGPAADVWLIVGLCSYAGMVVGANFAQNVFAYDGPGLALLYAAPVKLRTVFIAKNVVHASAALAVGLLLEVFYSVYVHRVGAGTAVLGMVALAGQLPVLLAAGNVLSVVAPRKFHASLRRRDRPPALATVVGLLVAAAAVVPAALVVRQLGRLEPGAMETAALAAFAAGSWGLYLAMLPRACELLESRRETVLRLVLRE